MIGARRPAAAVLAAALLVIGPAAVAAPPFPGGPATTATPGGARPEDTRLQAFVAWLDRNHKGYGCDDGPARFHNAAVEDAYPGRHFYYVLTYARGIAPSFPDSLSLVAEVNGAGIVRPLLGTPAAAYGPGLLRVTSAKTARRAAAAVLILAMGDPHERLWKVSEADITAKRTRSGWTCSYEHGLAMYTSEVTFDKNGALVGVQVNAPPVA